jgi:muramidase (phage lysozyme)
MIQKPRDREELAENLKNKDMQAFLRMIRFCEGTAGKDGYKTLVGGKLFDSFNYHPNIRVPIARYRIYSTAAGAYQILFRTWAEISQMFKLPDFSPACQDEAAVALIARRDSIMEIEHGDIRRAIEKCNKEWASLPGSPYNQRTESMENALDEYKKAGGLLYKR